MKISKIFAGMSALAIAAAMTVVPASAATTLTVENGETKEWSNCFPKFTNAEGKETDDFIDAKSLTKDSDLTMTIHFTWTDKGTEAGYCAIKPALADGWNPIYEEADSAKCGLPVKSALTESKNDDGSTTWLDADGNAVDVAIQDSDGFVQIYNTSVSEFTFTVTSDVVNTLVDAANAENGWGGLVFQVGNNGMQVTSIDFSQDGVKLNSQMPTGDDSNSDSNSDSKTDSKTDSKADSKADSKTDSKANSTAATTSSKAAGTTTATSSTAASDNTANTGATAGLALAGVALAGAAIVVAKRK